jgi:hypothetical protein
VAAASPLLAPLVVRLAGGLGGMRMFPISSTVLLGLIMAAGLIAVVANSFYPGVREAEKKAALGANAIAILAPELASNKERVDEDKRIINNGWNGTYIEDFDVSAWEAISKGGLLLGLDVVYVNKILKIYNIVEAYPADSGRSIGGRSFRSAAW